MIILGNYGRYCVCNIWANIVTILILMLIQYSPNKAGLVQSSVNYFIYQARNISTAWCGVYTALLMSPVLYHHCPGSLASLTPWWPVLSCWRREEWLWSSILTPSSAVMCTERTRRWWEAYVYILEKIVLRRVKISRRILGKHFEIGLKLASYIPSKYTYK